MIWAAAAFLALGTVFGLIGNLGVIRFPDVYTRLHASSKCSTTSVLSFLIACILLSGLTATTGRIIVIVVFLFITGPVTAHIIGARAWKRGIIPWRRGGAAAPTGEDGDG